MYATDKTNNDDPSESRNSQTLIYATDKTNNDDPSDLEIKKEPEAFLPNIKLPRAFSVTKKKPDSKKQIVTIGQLTFDSQ